MGSRIYLNDDWKFTEQFEEGLLQADYSGEELVDVRLPHTCKETAFHYFDENEYQMVSGYRRVIHADTAWKGQAVLLTIDGAAHDSKVYLNGEKIGEHHCGYTAFTMDISEKLKYGEDNVLVVKLDSRESLNVPPFGFVIDYMTYGGIYRDVYLDIKNPTYIEDVFVSTKLAGQVIEFENLVEQKWYCEKSATISEVTIHHPGDVPYDIEVMKNALAPSDFTEVEHAGNLTADNIDDKKADTVDGSVSSTNHIDLNEVAGTNVELTNEAVENVNLESDSQNPDEAAVKNNLESSSQDTDETIENNSMAANSQSAVYSGKEENQNCDGRYTIRQSIRKKGDEAYQELVSKEDAKVAISDAGSSKASQGSRRNVPKTLTCHTGKIELWDIEQPTLYELKTELLDDGKVVDEKVVTFGYRKAIFKKDGFYLNGRKIKIRGLNRHQSFPYVGYAMPKSMQERDADILKNELGVNAVRTSHYPQSHYFIDRCDEIGLLVFTEFPGWQHIGDEEWKKQAVDNVADMVKQYRNHTSIILWGVRINESVDDHDFYERTNAVAHAYDHTRQTGGVRCYKKGDFQEDVFTYNDFLHDGKRKGCDRKADVTSDVEKPYMISEFNGHMYPTKAFDWEEHRAQHAIRHANVLDEVVKQKDIAGCFGWCMFDYNTHKDFGSGDRICYHGVMDMFRNAKLAAAVYASQQEDTPVLELSSSMDIGEHPGCNRGDTYIFTNADSVKMYKNGEFIKEYTKEDSPYKYMKHGPILLNDFIGDTLEKGENMSHRQAEDVKALLNEVAKVGLYGLSKMMYAKAGKLMVMYHMKMEDAVQLYNKYVGDWGGESTVYRFEAIKDGSVVKTITKQPMKKIILKAEIDHDVLVEENSYDVAAVRITAVDEHDNLLPFFNDPVTFAVEGSGELIGPATVSLQGGMGGTYIKTTGKAGEGTLIISNGQSEDVRVAFSVACSE